MKFQTFKAERIALRDAPKAKYQLVTTDPTESQIDMLKKLEMPEDAYYEIVECCKKNNNAGRPKHKNFNTVEKINEAVDLLKSG